MAEFILTTELREILGKVFDKDADLNKIKREAKTSLIHQAGENPKLVYVICEKFVEFLIMDILDDPARYKLKREKIIRSWADACENYEDDDDS